jgi:hypothetical protein
MHTIETTTQVPIRQRQFRHPPHVEAEIDKQCKQLLDAGMIEHCDSPWNSPVFLIKKPSGEYRFILDYRRLNSITVPKFYPLPTLESCLDMVGQEKPLVFSALDLKSGYYSIRMHPDSAPKTAFSTRSGHYQWKSMPFGLQNAPATFCLAIHKLFLNELNSNMLIYLDDTIAFNATYAGHRALLEKIFQKLRDANLRLNPQKSQFGLSKLVYLGHQFSQDGISIDPSKTEVIRTYPRPKNQKEVRSFLGLTNYFKKFIRSYSSLTQPLRELLKNGIPFTWGDAHEKTFTVLKEKLCQSPILAFPDTSRPFIISTDASKHALGFILSQLDPEGRERVISYNGRATRPYEKNYTATELELCAIIQALVTYHPYIANQHFSIVTDHVSLKYIQTLKLGNSRLIRWSLMLSQYHFTISHRKGKLNTPCDTLSRLTYPEDNTTEPLMDVDPTSHLLAIRHKQKRLAIGRSTEKSAPLNVQNCPNQSVSDADVDQRETGTSGDDVVVVPPPAGPVERPLPLPSPITLNTTDGFILCHHYSIFTGWHATCR